MTASLGEAMPRLAAIAAQALGWPPNTLWSATPDDLVLALGPVETGEAPLTRTELDTLMKAQGDG